MYHVGERPGAGLYRCSSCHRWTVALSETKDRLPPCAICGPRQQITYLTWGEQRLPDVAGPLGLA